MSPDMNNALIYFATSVILLIVGAIVYSAVQSWGKKDDEDDIAIMKEQLQFLFDSHNDKTEDGVYKWHITSDMRKLPKQLEKAKREIIATINKRKDDE